jgi:hypothetical protein
VQSDRRRRPRFTFPQPVRAEAGGAAVYVFDLSQIGVGIAHEAPLPPPGAIVRVSVPSELGLIRLDCAIVRTVQRYFGNAAKALFYTGLEVLSADRQSEARLRILASRA